MAFSPLPDRERRHLLQFYAFPAMDYARRLAAAGGLIGVGMLIQILWRPVSYGSVLAASLPLIFFGNLFLLVRGYNLRPEGMSGSGEWEKTTRDRFARTRILEQEVRRWDEAFTDITCVTGFVGLVAVTAIVLIGMLILKSAPETRYWSSFLVVDAAALLLPHWVTGTRRGWRPVGLHQQIDALETGLKAIETRPEPPCQIQPMFEMRGTGRKRVPAAARAFIRFPDGPEDFLGLQFQVSLNDVQGTKYPYFYAVIVARRSFGLLDHLEEVERRIEGLIVENSSEGDVDAVVVRQKTTRKSGYHTKDPAIRRISREAWEAVRFILSAVPAA